MKDTEQKKTGVPLINICIAGACITLFVVTGDSLSDPVKTGGFIGGLGAVWGSVYLAKWFMGDGPNIKSKVKKGEEV